MLGGFYATLKYFLCILLCLYVIEKHMKVIAHDPDQTIPRAYVSVLVVLVFTLSRSILAF